MYMADRTERFDSGDPTERIPRDEHVSIPFRTRAQTTPPPPGLANRTTSWAKPPPPAPKPVQRAPRPLVSGWLAFLLGLFLVLGILIEAVVLITMAGLVK